MPDHPVERGIRTLQTGISSLLRAAGVTGERPTPAAAEAFARRRSEPLPPPTSDPIESFLRRMGGAVGAYPIPGETPEQYHDATFGAPEQWFPTKFLSDIARGDRSRPRDINLPDPMAGKEVASTSRIDPRTGMQHVRVITGGERDDPRWRDYAKGHN